MSRQSRWNNSILRAPAIVIAVASLLASPDVTSAQDHRRSIAFLGVNFQNDNQSYEPTSDAERARMAALEAQLKSELQKSGRYGFVTMTPAIKAKIDAGQPVGACGGCEFDYGKFLGADTIAWVVVQKISNLIMNMNVYVGDVPAGKMLFMHSVDVRGNTDESWSRSMSYLLKNYLLIPPPAGAG